jgi:hypothetical protein
MSKRARAHRFLLPSALSLACGLALAACSGSSSSSSEPVQSLFSARPTTVGCTPLLASGGLFAYLADESTCGPGGTDFNGNGQVTDTIPIVVEPATQTEYNLQVAAIEIAWAGQNLYLVVDELEDGRNWISPPTDDLVLVHWAEDQPLTPLTTLDRRATRHLVSTGENLFFARASGASGPSDTTLAMVTAAEPLTLRPVQAADGGGALFPTLLGADEGMVLAALDEDFHARDLNGDLDFLDRRVLALLNGTTVPTGATYGSPLRNTGLASRSTGSTPFRAKAQTDGSAWLVAFLVNEADQGGTNFNTTNHPDIPASWFPTQCVGSGNLPDTDTLDDVLFFLRFQPWASNPVANPPVNTGLVGKNRIAIVQDYIGTVSQESALDQGFGEPCDLNGDGDRLDDIFRWVKAQTPILPPRSVEFLFPAGNVPGGTFGIAELGSRWLLAVSEAQDGTDFNGDGELSLDVVAWLDPAGTAGWTFNHAVQGDPIVVAATWMGETQDRQRVGVGFSERARNLDVTGNGNATDSVATFAWFDEANQRVSFPGYGVATLPDNAGVVIQNGYGFYRVSEAHQGADINGDGQANDILVWASRLFDGQTLDLHEHNAIARRAVDPDQPSPPLCAFLVDESKAGDVNQDGHAEGFAVVYFAWQTP